jgi:hypothetical protein
VQLLLRDGEGWKRGEKRERKVGGEKVGGKKNEQQAKVGTFPFFCPARRWFWFCAFGDSRSQEFSMVIRFYFMTDAIGRLYYGFDIA